MPKHNGKLYKKNSPKHAKQKQRRKNKNNVRWKVIDSNTNQIQNNRESRKSN